MDYINMDYKNMDYKEKLERAKELYTTANADQRYVLECLFPELKESEDERIRKGILEHIQLCTESIPDRDKYIAWLERQGETYTKKDIDDAYIEGMTFAKSELEKQSEQKPAEWSEEDEKHINHISDFIMRNRVGDTDTIYHLEQDVNWLKSLKERIGG